MNQGSPSRASKMVVHLAIMAAICTFILAACGGSPAAQEVPGGDPERGQLAIQQYGCPACHTIPGIPDADAHVGPPLTNWAERQYIAGTLPNIPENLIHWIQNPQRVEPDTAMPWMGVSEQDARDISAYLYTIEE